MSTEQQTTVPAAEAQVSVAAPQADNSALYAKVRSLLGIKLGMAKVFGKKGEVIPVTLVQAGPCPIVSVRNKDNDGYTSIQVAYRQCREKNVSKPVAGIYKKANLKPCRWLKEFRVDSVDGFQVGQELKVDMFKEGELVDVSGFTKGKGFQGVMRRHDFKGGPRTHGQSNRQRSPGAIGSQSPQRVKKGTRMAGHLGDEWKTVRNLVVEKVVLDNNILALKGSVPGPNNSSFLVIRRSKIQPKPKVVQAPMKEKKSGKAKPGKESSKKK